MPVIGCFLRKRKKELGWAQQSQRMIFLVRTKRWVRQWPISQKLRIGVQAAKKYNSQFIQIRIPIVDCQKVELNYYFFKKNIQNYLSISEFD